MHVSTSLPLVRLHAIFFHLQRFQIFDIFYGEYRTFCKTIPKNSIIVNAARDLTQIYWSITLDCSASCRGCYFLGYVVIFCKCSIKQNSLWKNLIDENCYFIPIYLSFNGHHKCQLLNILFVSILLTFALCLTLMRM